MLFRSLVAEERRIVEHAARYVLIMVEQVDRLRTLGHQRHTDVENAFLRHMAVAQLDILVHIVVAEAVRELLIEYILRIYDCRTVPALGERHRMIVCQFVGIVPAVAEAVGESQEVAGGRL